MGYPGDEATPSFVSPVVKRLVSALARQGVIMLLLMEDTEGFDPYSVRGQMSL